jgi:hypothetical protein
VVSAPAAQPAAPEPARLWAPAELLERIARGELPAALSGAESAQVVDIRYCAPDEKGRGRALVAFTPTAPAKSVKALRSPKDCEAGLETLAQRVLTAAGAKSAAVAEIAGGLRGRELAFAIEKVALAGEKAPEALRALAPRTALPPIPVGPLKIGPPGSQMTLGLAMEWRKEGVAVAAGPGAPAARGGPERAPESGLAAELPLPLLNTLLETALRREPLRIRADPETVEVTNIRFNRGESSLLATGRATPLSVGQSFNLTVDLVGSDLQIGGVQVEADLEDCSSFGVLQRAACTIRNQGRRTAAQALAAGLRQHYQGRTVRSLVGPQQLELNLAGQARQLRAELTRLSAREATLGAEATVTVER